MLNNNLYNYFLVYIRLGSLTGIKASFDRHTQGLQLNQAARKALEIRLDKSSFDK